MGSNISSYLPSIYFILVIKENIKPCTLNSVFYEGKLTVNPNRSLPSISEKTDKFNC